MDFLSVKKKRIINIYYIGQEPIASMYRYSIIKTRKRKYLNLIKCQNYQFKYLLRKYCICTLSNGQFLTEQEIK